MMKLDALHLAIDLVVTIGGLTGLYFVLKPEEPMFMMLGWILGRMILKDALYR